MREQASWRRGLELHLEDHVGTSRAESRERVWAEGGVSRKEGS